MVNEETLRQVPEGVLCRKTSGGTDAPRENQFVECVLTVVHTCQQQEQNVLGYFRCLYPNMATRPSATSVAGRWPRKYTYHCP
jgi:hypothetical protein